MSDAGILAGILALPDYRQAYFTVSTTPSRQAERAGRRITAQNNPSMVITPRTTDDLMAGAKALETRGETCVPLYGIWCRRRDGRGNNSRPAGRDRPNRQTRSRNHG